LVWACENGHLDTVKYLVEKGANIMDQDNEAMILACKEGHLKVVKYLVSQGAFIEANSLIVASSRGNLEIVKYLVSQDVDITAQNNKAIILADKHCHYDIVEYLSMI
jgi:ankyrin repeat protein